MRRSSISGISLALVCIALIGHEPRALADRFDDGERMTERFLDHCRDLRRLDVEQVRSLVTAICDAEEDDRRSVAREAAGRARDKVGYEFDKLEREKNDALATLDAVLADASFKDKHGRANQHKRRVVDAWESVRNMTDKVRGSNHPVIAYMLETGLSVPSVAGNAGASAMIRRSFFAAAGSMRARIAASSSRSQRQASARSSGATDGSAGINCLSMNLAASRASIPSCMTSWVQLGGTSTRSMVVPSGGT